MDDEASCEALEDEEGEKAASAEEVEPATRQDLSSAVKDKTSARMKSE